MSLFDIILKDAESFEEEKTIANTISNEVYLEGVKVRPPGFCIIPPQILHS